MPKPRVRRVQEIDLNNIEFAEVTENSFGGKVVYLKYINEDGEKENLYLQTPKMHNSWGVHISQAMDASKNPTGDPRYYLQMSFGKNEEMKGSLLKFHELMDELDEIIKTEAKENCVSWLKIKKNAKTADLLEEKYRPQIQFSVDDNLERDGKYPDSVRFKIPYDNENKVFYNSVEVYDEEGNFQNTKAIGDMQKWLTKGSKVISIVQLSSIYFAGGNFGLSWKVVQMQSFPRTDSLKGFAIQNDEDEESDNIVSQEGDEEV